MYRASLAAISVTDVCNTTLSFPLTCPECCDSPLSIHVFPKLDWFHHLDHKFIHFTRQFGAFKVTVEILFLMIFVICCCWFFLQNELVSQNHQCFKHFDILSGLIWVQTVWKGHQQMTTASNKLNVELLSKVSTRARWHVPFNLHILCMYHQQRLWQDCVYVQTCLQQGFIDLICDSQTVTIFSWLKSIMPLQNFPECKLPCI